MGTITIGIDPAKARFSTCTQDAAGRVIQRRNLDREAYSHWLLQIPVGTVVAMEACSGAHAWARRCLEYGLRPNLIAAQSPSRSARARPPRMTAMMQKPSPPLRGRAICASCR